MDFKSLHFQSVACPRMRTLVLQTMDFQSIVVDCYNSSISFSGNPEALAIIEISTFCCFNAIAISIALSFLILSLSLLRQNPSFARMVAPFTQHLTAEVLDVSYEVPALHTAILPSCSLITSGCRDNSSSASWRLDWMTNSIASYYVISCFFQCFSLSIRPREFFDVSDITIRGFLEYRCECFFHGCTYYFVIYPS